MGIFYATQTGNTETVASKLAEATGSPKPQHRSFKKRDHIRLLLFLLVVVFVLMSVCGVFVFAFVSVFVLVLVLVIVVRVFVLLVLLLLVAVVVLELLLWHSHVDSCPDGPVHKYHLLHTSPVPS